MKILDELLGFVVLSGPLFLIVIWLPVSIWIAVKLAKRIFSNRTTRMAGGLGLAVILFILPFATEIIGRVYHSHLCATEYELKAFNTVELPAKYWGEQGEPTFLHPNGILNYKVIGQRFEWVSAHEPYINGFIKIEKNRATFRDKLTKKNLGERITFVRYYGWLNQFSTAPNIRERCRNIWVKKYGREKYFQKESIEDRNFYLKIFVPPDSVK